jgi:acyl dehydratase
MTTTVAFDDLKSLVGAKLGPSDWLEVTQQRINTFADATDDHQWIHVDPQRAKAGPFGGPIAHGFLTLSLLIPLFSQVLDVTDVATKVNYGLNKVRFPAPVPAGSRLRLSGTLSDVEEVADNGVQITVDIAIEVEGGTKPVCVATIVVRQYV